MDKNEPSYEDAKKYFKEHKERCEATMHRIGIKDKYYFIRHYLLENLINEWRNNRGMA